MRRPGSRRWSANIQRSGHARLWSSVGAKIDANASPFSGVGLTSDPICLHIQELVAEGYPVDEQTIRLLGPYRTEHVNRFGSYTLNMDREISPLEIKFELPT